MEYRAQDLYDYHVSQMQREEYDMDDPLQLGRYSPEVFDRVEDPATSYQPAETHFFEDAIFSFNDPANRRSDEDSISRSTRTGQGNRPASLAVTERVIKNRDTGRDVDPGVASNPFMGLIKAVREKTKRNDALVRRSGLPKHSILGKQFKSALSYASHQGGNETSNAGLNGEDTSSVSGPLSHTKVDRATPTSSLTPTYTAPMPPPTTAHVARMSPSTIVHVGSMPSLTTAVAPARDTPPPKTTRGVATGQSVSSASRYQNDRILAKGNGAKWSAAEEQAILALYRKYTAPGSRTCRHWDALMAEYNTRGGRRERKALQQMVHKIDPTIKRGGNNNGGTAIKAKKAAMLAEANGGSV